MSILHLFFAYDIHFTLLEITCQDFSVCFLLVLSPMLTTELGTLTICKYLLSKCGVDLCLLSMLKTFALFLIIEWEQPSFNIEFTKKHPVGI